MLYLRRYSFAVLLSTQLSLTFGFRALPTQNRPGSDRWQPSCSPARARPSSPSWVCMVRKKEFNKKYDGAFDGFGTSGSMPDVPSMDEQYQRMASFVQAEKRLKPQGIDEPFGGRVTEQAAALQREKEAGYVAYEELKEKLLSSTATIGMLGLSLFILWTPQKTAISYLIGEPDFGFVRTMVGLNPRRQFE